MSKLLAALRNENNGPPPLWMMRQAGRYLPEYRALKEKYSFQEMYKNPQIAAEVTMQPLRRFPLDAAIIFSDLLVVAEALGPKLHYEEKIGPVFEKPLKMGEKLPTAQEVDIRSSLNYVAEAIKMVKSLLSVPVLGFAGAPLTVASYLIEGSTSRSLAKTKKWMLQDPVSFEILLETICEATIEYLKLQVEAGASALQIFDSWACYLSYDHFKRYSSRFFKRIVEAMAPTPIILFTKGTAGFVDLLVDCAPAAISIDWSCSLEVMRRQIPQPIALQGNLDPDILYGPAEEIRRHTTGMLESMAGEKRYIVNLGHGILPDIPISSVETFIDTVKNYA